MSETITSPGIYLIVEFDWPRPFAREHAQAAADLHKIVQGQTWIQEVVAASGGVGEGPSSVWIFWLENYAALDTLLNDQSNEICQAYVRFFSQMPLVKDCIREKVIFR